MADSVLPCAVFNNISIHQAINKNKSMLPLLSLVNFVTNSAKEVFFNISPNTPPVPTITKILPSCTTPYFIQYCNCPTAFFQRQINSTQNL
jgi:hypothetical protein